MIYVTLICCQKSLDVFNVYGHETIDISGGKEGSRITRVCKNVTPGKVAAFVRLRIRHLTINLNPVWTFFGTLLLQFDQPEAGKLFFRVQLVNDVSLHNRTTAHCKYAAIQSTYSICREFKPRNVPDDISDILLPCKSLSKEQMLSLVLLYVAKREEKK